MKRFITAILIFTGLNVYAQIDLPDIKGEQDWEKVIITRNSGDVEGLNRMTNLSSEAMKIYGRQSKLREEATIKIKKEAAKIGASIVFITVDNFSMTPLNNVSLEGTAYSLKESKPSIEAVVVTEDVDEKSVVESSLNLPEINGEQDWEKVIITRIVDDVKGLKRINNLRAESMKVYGKQSKLRTEATEKLKREAAKIGAQIVIITVDNFSMTPLNNVSLEGTAYKQ